jgi:predicted dehydrogenase
MNGARVYRGVLVGLGNIAEGHLHGYARVPNLEIAAVVDTNPLRRSIAQSRFGLPAFEDLATACAHTEVDFLDVCTPPDSHAEHMCAALDRDLPVLCEKPVLVPGTDRYEVLNQRLSEESRIYPCQNYLFAPVFAEVRRLLAAGAIGELTSVGISIRRRGHALGTADWLPDWRRLRRFSRGGILRDHGPHSMNLLTAVAGLDPVAVACVTASMQAETAGFDTEDTAVLRVLGEDSREAHVMLTWASAERQSRYDFRGTAGSISVNDDTLTVTNSEDCWARTIDSGFNDPRHSAWFADMFRDFAGMLAEDRWSADGGCLRDAIASAELIEAAYRSADAGGSAQPVRASSFLKA